MEDRIASLEMKVLELRNVVELGFQSINSTLLTLSSEKMEVGRQRASELSESIVLVESEQCASRTSALAPRGKARGAWREGRDAERVEPPNRSSIAVTKSLATPETCVASCDDAEECIIRHRNMVATMLCTPAEQAPAPGPSPNSTLTRT